MARLVLVTSVVLVLGVVSAPSAHAASFTTCSPPNAFPPRTLSVSASDDRPDAGPHRALREVARLRAGRSNRLGAAQLSADWAKVYVFERPFRELGRYRAGESAARAAGRGTWATCGGDFHRTVAVAQASGGRGAPGGADVAAAQTGCSRREALLHLRRTGKISPRAGVGRAVGGRIYRFLCSDFTGDGRPDMAMTISLGGSGAAVYWTVLRRLSSGGLSVGLFRREARTGMRLESPTEFAVVQPIIGPTDDYCCEVDGFRYRRFGWDGARFVLRAEEVLPGSTYRDAPTGFY